MVVEAARADQQGRLPVALSSTTSTSVSVSVPPASVTVQLSRGARDRRSAGIEGGIGVVAAVEQIVCRCRRRACRRRRCRTARRCRCRRRASPPWALPKAWSLPPLPAKLSGSGDSPVADERFILVGADEIVAVRGRIDLDRPLGRIVGEAVAGHIIVEVDRVGPEREQVQHAGIEADRRHCPRW